MFDEATSSCQMLLIRDSSCSAFVSDCARFGLVGTVSEPSLDALGVPRVTVLFHVVDAFESHIIVPVLSGLLAVWR
jgi:hypothetical protein